MTREQVQAAVKAKGLVWFDSKKDYDVNIVCVRNSNPGKSVTNVFDDWITVSYTIGGNWMFHCWPGTTDPGRKGVKNFTNPNGVARVVPGQYRGSHMIGMHKGQYEALVQRRPVKVFRDKNKDLTFDEVTIDSGMFGINIHRSNPKTESQYVEDWSLGCMVFKRKKDFDQFMDVMRRARAHHGNAMTLTVIESKDLPE